MSRSTFARFTRKTLIAFSFYNLNRSSRSQHVLKIGGLKNFANFTVKHLCWTLFLIKLLTWMPETLLKGDYNTVCPWNLRIFQKHLFLQNTCGGFYLSSNICQLIPILPIWSICLFITYFSLHRILCLTDIYILLQLLPFFHAHQHVKNPRYGILLAVF